MTKVEVKKPSDSSVPTTMEVDLPADYLLQELEGNKHVDQKVKAMIKEVILGDREVDTEICKIVDKIEKEKVKIFLTKIGFGVWSIAMIVLGAVLPVIIDVLRGKS